MKKTQLLFTTLTIIPFTTTNSIVHIQNYYNFDLVKVVNVEYHDSFNGTFTPKKTIKEKFLTFNWRIEKNSWSDFYITYPIIKFNSDSRIGVYNKSYQNPNNYIYEFKPLLEFWTMQITEQPTEFNRVQIFHHGGFMGARVWLIGSIIAKRDATYIYFYYQFYVESSFSKSGNHINFDVKTVTFESQKNFKL